MTTKPTQRKAVQPEDVAEYVAWLKDEGRTVVQVISREYGRWVEVVYEV